MRPNGRRFSMVSRSRALVLAGVLAAALCAGPGAAKEPEGGVFPGEEGRLPGKEERDALGLLFEEADLFLAPERPPAGAGGFRVFWALKNPKGFSSRKVAEGAPRPPMDFLGWGLVAGRGGTLHLAAFGPSGRFSGGATSPPDKMPPPLRRRLSGMVGRRPKEAAERLRAYAELDPKRAEALGLSLWEKFFVSFRKVREAAESVAPPPARTVPRLPGPGTALKILAVVVVIGLLSLFNVGLARRRRAQEEMEQRFDGRRMRWKG
ncbi:hypothetical protein ACFLQ0_01005 [Nitrospinota bacterium]